MSVIGAIAGASGLLFDSFLSDAKQGIWKATYERAPGSRNQRLILELRLPCGCVLHPLGCVRPGANRSCRFSTFGLSKPVRKTRPEASNGSIGGSLELSWYSRGRGPWKTMNG